MLAGSCQLGDVVSRSSSARGRAFAAIRFLIGAPRETHPLRVRRPDRRENSRRTPVTRVLTPRARSSIQTSRVPIVLLRRMVCHPATARCPGPCAVDAARRRRLAVERDPGQIAIDLADRARDIGQRAGRDVEVGAPEEIRDHAVDDGNRRTCVIIRRSASNGRGCRPSDRAREMPTVVGSWTGARVSAALDQHAMLALARALNGNARRLPAGVVPDAEKHRGA